METKPTSRPPSLLAPSTATAPPNDQPLITKQFCSILADAGVNIDAADEALKRAKTAVKRTFDENVLQEIGNFGAMYRFDPSGMKIPIEQ